MDILEKDLKLNLNFDYFDHILLLPVKTNGVIIQSQILIREMYKSKPVIIQGETTQMFVITKFSLLKGVDPVTPTIIPEGVKIIYKIEEKNIKKRFVEYQGELVKPVNTGDITNFFKSEDYHIYIKKVTLYKERLQDKRKVIL